MHIGVVAGEASGDLLGAGMMRAIKDSHPDVRFSGVAGPLMREAGCDVWEDSEVLAVMGLVEPLKVLPKLIRLRRSLIDRWSELRPDVFVGIDAPEFNLGLERKLREKGIRTIQYVSPQVWAWRQRRVKKIGRAVDKVLCLLPFEKEFYDRHGVPAEVVGHPLADNLPTDLDRLAERQALGIRSRHLLTIMPGSRAGEVRRLGPVFAQTAKVLADRHEDLAFAAPMANAQARATFCGQLEDAGIGSQVVLTDGNAPRAIAAADVVLLASGTASLQTALLQRPIVSAYRVAPATYYLARMLRLLKVKHFTMPNLLTREPLVPEFLQHEATPEALGNAIESLLSDPARRRHIEDTFAELRTHLGLGADRRAAQAVIRMASRSGS